MYTFGHASASRAIHLLFRHHRLFILTLSILGKEQFISLPLNLPRSHQHTMPPLCSKCGAPDLKALLQMPLVSSDVTRLQTSNDVPLDHEAISICHLIVEGQDRVDALNAAIDMLHASVAQLVQKRDEAIQSVHDHKSVLSAARRVPPELLCAIFSMTSPCTRRVEGNNVHQPPWHLAHVCRSWRETALS
jgi:hypothetical protein